MIYKNKSIRLTFNYEGVRCRETLKLPPTAANLKYAQALRQQILNEIALGTFQYANHFPHSSRCAIFGHTQKTNTNVADALDGWLLRQQRSLAHSTLNVYTKAVDAHLKPAFGRTPLQKLSTAMIRTWVSQTTLAPKTVNNILTPLRQMLADAFDDGVIERNPCLRVRALKTESPEPDPFDANEMGEILKHLHGQVKNIIQFAFFTGLRTSELIALRWDDIDFMNEVVRVRRAKVLRQIKVTKTVAGIRDVRLLLPALEALAAQKAHTFLANAEIFHNPNTNRPWVSDKALREAHWAHALKRAGVRYRYPYQTRHTYASMMLSAGENPMWVANQMGHTNMGVLLKRYARWLPDTNPDAGGKMLKVWSDGQKTVKR